jgi:hypothetical protein
MHEHLLGFANATMNRYNRYGCYSSSDLRVSLTPQTGRTSALIA